MTPSEWSVHAVTARKFPLGIRWHPSLAGGEIERDYHDSDKRGGRQKKGFRYIHAHYMHRDRSCQERTVWT